MFPTIKTLEQLAPFESAAAILAWASGREVVPIEPQVVVEGEVARVVLPGRAGLRGMSDELRRATIAVHAGRGARRGDPLNPPLVPGVEVPPLGYARNEGTPRLGGVRGGGRRAGGRQRGRLRLGHGARSPPCSSSCRSARASSCRRRLHRHARRCWRARGGRAGWRSRSVDIADTAAVLAACAGADLLWVETPTNPLVGDRRARRAVRGRARRRRAGRRSTRRSPPRCCSARSSSAPTSSSTARRSSSAATPTCCWGSPVARDAASGPSSAAPGAAAARRHAGRARGVPRAARAAHAGGAARARPGHRRRARRAAGGAPGGRARPLPRPPRRPRPRARRAADGRLRRGARVRGRGRRRRRRRGLRARPGAHPRDEPRRRRDPDRAPRPLPASSSRPTALLRVSVGLEDVEDLWRDLERALARPRPGPGAAASPR